MPIIAKHTLDHIEAGVVERADSEFRKHLGASIIGRECAREIWFIFRWAKKVTFEGRITRLFNRGHDEEPRLIQWLRDAGVTVYEKDENGKQFRISGHSGHFGGSLDAVLVNVPDLPLGIPALGEFKTFNDKWFQKLLELGLFGAKPEHYTQKVLYMEGYNLEYGLYLGINKNDDTLYGEIIKRDPPHAARYYERAKMIIYTEEAPPRMSNNPTWWKCKFCDFHSICHKNEVPAINCRTCSHSTPVDGGWSCRFNRPEIQTQQGCEWHSFLPHMINGVEYLNPIPEEKALQIKLPSGEIIFQGPNHVTSEELCSFDITKKKP